MENEIIETTIELGYSINEESKALIRDFLELIKKIIFIIYYNNPNRWWKLTAKLLIRIHKGEINFKSSNYFKKKAGKVLSIMKRDLSQKDPFSNDVAFSALRKIMKIAEIFLPPRPEPELDIKFIPLEEMAKNPNITVKKIGEGDIILEIGDARIILPNREGFYYKGGVSRLILKILLGTDISAEIPLNDFDAIVSEGGLGDFSLFQDRYGLDPTGIEIYNKKEIVIPVDIQRLLQGRDLNTNQSVVSKKGIFFSPAAKKAILSGITESLYAHHRIFGTDGFIIPSDGKYPTVYTLRTRGLGRVYKMIAEGKAMAGLIKKIEKQIDLGIYWLVYLRKALNKPASEKLIERYFLLAQELGHTLPDEDPLNFFDRQFSRYPFFIFGKKLNRIETVYWIICKFFKTLWNELRYLHFINRNPIFQRSFDDSEKILIGKKLADRENADRQRIIKQYLSQYRKRWKKISKETNKDQSPLRERIKRIFY